VSLSWLVEIAVTSKLMNFVKAGAIPTSHLSDLPTVDALDANISANSYALHKVVHPRVSLDANHHAEYLDPPS
jgi:predicted nuclease of predicted toxin-antitoxin system